MDGYITATYRFSTNENAVDTIKSLAREQSTTGYHTINKKYSVTEQKAEVRSITQKQKLGENNYVARVDYPTVNFSGGVTSLDDILCFVVGETHHISGFDKLTLIDLDIPTSYEQKLPGPRYGVNGVRNLLSTSDTPLLMGPLRPEVGLSPSEYATVAAAAWRGGADIVKDDELLTNPDYCPLSSRARECVEAAKRVEEDVNERKLYVANVGGDVNLLRERLGNVSSMGVDGVMVHPKLTPSILSLVRNLWDGIIISHYATLTCLGMGNSRTISPHVILSLYRASGADIITLPRPNKRFSVPFEEYKQCIEVCLQQNNRVKKSFPAPTGGNSSDSVDEVKRMCKSTDYIFVSGGALFEHPDGIFEGAKSLRRKLDSLDSPE